MSFIILQQYFLRVWDMGVSISFFREHARTHLSTRAARIIARREVGQVILRSLHIVNRHVTHRSALSYADLKNGGSSINSTSQIYPHAWVDCLILTLDLMTCRLTIRNIFWPIFWGRKKSCASEKPYEMLGVTPNVAIRVLYQNSREK